jgi:hypothetical protein
MSTCDILMSENQELDSWILLQISQVRLMFEYVGNITNIKKPLIESYLRSSSTVSGAK